MNTAGDVSCGEVLPCGEGCSSEVVADLGCVCHCCLESGHAVCGLEDYGAEMTGEEVANRTGSRIAPRTIARRTSALRSRWAACSISCAYVWPLARVAQLATFECIVAQVGVDEADPLDGVVGMRVIVDGLDDYDSAVRSLLSDTLKRYLTKLIGSEREPAEAPQVDQNGQEESRRDLGARLVEGSLRPA